MYFLQNNVFGKFRKYENNLMSDNFADNLLLLLKSYFYRLTCQKINSAINEGPDLKIIHNYVNK